MKSILLFIVLLIIVFISPSQSVLAYSQELYYVVDPNHKYTEADIIELFKNDKSTFTKTYKAINLRLISDKIWIIADSQVVASNQVAVLKNPYIDQIILHPFDGNKFLPQMVAGDNHSFNNRSYQYIFPNFEYTKNAKILCFEVSSKGPMKVPLNFYTHQKFWEIIQDNVSFHFFYFGILLFTILLSLGVYSWVRNSIFIWYSLSVIGTGLITAYNYGYMFKSFWPDNPEINQYSLILLSCSILNLLFVEKLLNLKVNNKVLFYSFRVFYVISFIINAICCFDRSPAVNEALMLIFCLFPILPVAAGIVTFKKIQANMGLLYMIGVGLFFTSISIYVLLLSGLIALNVITDNIIQIGSILEILFFNIALIVKMKHYQQEQEVFLKNEKIALEQTIGSRTLELTLKNKLIEQKNSLLQNQHEILENTVRERTVELVKTNTALNDRNFRLEQFANVTAHNLRGPIATLLGLANIFNKQKLDDPLNEKIIYNVQESAAKVDSILRDLSTLLDNHQNAQSLIEEVELESIFVDVMAMLKSEFEKSGGRITTEFSFAPTCYTVPVYIKNIFYNLISNGLKYVQPGSFPQLDIKSYKTNGHVCIEFRDKGIGINLKQFGENLFKPYKRFHMSYPGKGLGLYTCKTQIEAMGGKMLIQSEVNFGTSFVIYLPDQPNEEKFSKMDVNDYAL